MTPIEQFCSTVEPRAELRGKIEKVAIATFSTAKADASASAFSFLGETSRFAPNPLLHQFFACGIPYTIPSQDVERECFRSVHVIATKRRHREEGSVQKTPASKNKEEITMFGGFGGGFGGNNCCCIIIVILLICCCCGGGGWEGGCDKPRPY